MSNLMFGANKFKLGVFCVNTDGAMALTRVPERWPAQWDEIVEVAQLIDEAGFEFYLPLARWKGYGGEHNVRRHSFESFTHVSALAALTRHITLCTTVQVPIVPPVFAAKALTTLDHISHGRAALNIVCGYNQPELDMFGITEFEHAYERGEEWFDIVMRIYQSDEPFDYHGEFYDLIDVEGAPKPIQQPRPVVITAGFSPQGRDYAARTSDFLFTVFTELEQAKVTLADISERARLVDRQVRVISTCHVVCRDTQTEAEDYYHHYGVDMADNQALDRQLAIQKGRSVFAHLGELEQHRLSFAAGGGSYPLIGTPRMIADEMIKMSEVGLDGAALCFVNFKNELPGFIRDVVPLLEQAGLRESAEQVSTYSPDSGSDDDN